MTWAITAHIRTLGTRAKSLLDQIDDHGNKLWMNSNGRCSNEMDSQFLAFCSSLFIEVVQNLHVITDETQGLNDEMFWLRFMRQLFDPVAHVRFQPWLLRRSRPTLKRQFPI